MSRRFTSDELGDKVSSFTKLMTIEESNSKIGLGSKIRNIDLFIHRWDKPDTIETDIIDFLTHQLKIIALTDGEASSIFNDGRVYNGITGPMTDILRTCYLTLYSKLIYENLEIDQDKDFNIFISLLFGILYNSEEDKLLIPTSEFYAIKRIIIFFKRKMPDKFNDEWWDKLIQDFTNIYDNILPTWEFWQKTQNRRSSSIWDRYTNKKDFVPGIWEKHPCYIIDYQDNLDLDKEKTLRRFRYLKEFFNNPDSKTNIDIISCSPISPEGDLSTSLAGATAVKSAGSAAAGNAAAGGASAGSVAAGSASAGSASVSGASAGGASVGSAPLPPPPPAGYMSTSSVPLPPQPSAGYMSTNAPLPPPPPAGYMSTSAPLPPPPPAGYMSTSSVSLPPQPPPLAGGSSTVNYINKYLKYKEKYLKLKSK